MRHVIGLSGGKDSTALAMGHTFRSPGRDTWPSALSDLAKEFERGRLIRADSRQGERCRACSL